MRVVAGLGGGAAAACYDRAREAHIAGRSRSLAFLIAYARPAYWPVPYLVGLGMIGEITPRTPAPQQLGTARSCRARSFCA